MLLNSLTLENFKIFNGMNIIKFTPIDDGNVVLIQGDNGHGKTTIMDSIFWALYGRERKHEKLVKPNMIKLINDYAKDQGDFFCRVALEFTHEGRIYNIERKVEPKRGKAPRSANEMKEKVTLKINGKEEPDLTGVLDEVFPEDIATFFFFDGETIAKYAEAYTSNKETIEKALGIPYLRNGAADIGRLRKAMENELGDLKLSPVIERIERDLKANEAKLDDKRKMLGITDKMLENLTNDMHKLQDMMAEFEDLRAINKRIKDLEDFQTEIDNDEMKLQEQESAFVKALPNLILRRHVKQASEDVSTMKDDAVTAVINRGRLLDQKDFLEHLVATNTCICGSEFMEESLGRLKAMLGAIDEQLASLKEVNVERYSWANADIAQSLAGITGLEDKVSNLHQMEAKRGYISENRTRIEKAMKFERECLANHSAANSREKEVYDKLTKISQDRLIYQAKRADLGEETKSLERKVADLESQLRKELEMQNHETRKLAKEIGMLQSLEGAVDEIIENSAELKRKAIVNRSSTIFHRITNKPQEYVGLDIDPENFTVTVRGTGGTTVNTKDLSDGEKHVVALSFLGGIKESAADGTLIIDSPFGRLDQTHKSRLISNIGDLAKNVILLVTDEDLDGTELKAMKTVQKHYNLTHDQKKKFSTVVDVMAATAAGASAMLTMPSQPQTPKGPEGGA